MRAVPIAAVVRVFFCAFSAFSLSGVGVGVGTSGCSPASSKAAGTPRSATGNEPATDANLRTEEGGTGADDGHDEHAGDGDEHPGSNEPTVENGEEPDDAPPLATPTGIPTASRYAALDRARCEAELGKRRIPFERVSEARGVVAPLRLAGPISGVTFRSNLPASQRKTSPYEIYDCRLVLALDDFAKILTRHDVVEVVHLSVYRPVSKRVALKGAGRRHAGALAIDAAIFKTKDGRSMSVEKDFRGRIGARPCPAREASGELQKIACEAADARLFNVLLTPHYNWAHRNHFHLEVTAGVKWSLVR